LSSGVARARPWLAQVARQSRPLHRALSLWLARPGARRSLRFRRGHLAFSRVRKLGFLYGRPDDQALVFPAASGELWREHDQRNWRRRTYQRACTALRLDVRRPYDLRHAAASLWLHEGRSVVEGARWLGHSPAMCLSTYTHVVDQLRDAPRVDAEEAIRAARVPAQYPRQAANA
jgi:integrase